MCCKIEKRRLQTNKKKIEHYLLTGQIKID